jgi:hypothetical protein
MIRGRRSKWHPAVIDPRSRNEGGSRSGTLLRTERLFVILPVSNCYLCILIIIRLVVVFVVCSQTPLVTPPLAPHTWSGPLDSIETGPAPILGLAVEWTR